MKNIKKFIPYLILFILFLIIMFLSPISGDDWGNYLVGSKGIYNSIGNAIGMYFDWEGRFVSRILINVLTYNKPIWNIINSVVIVSIIYYVTKLVKPFNKKLVFFLSLFLILFMNIYTFSQVVVWIAGNITYLFVIPLLLYYLYKVIYLKDEKKSSFIFLIFLNFIMTMFVEHVAVILVVFNIFINLHSIFKYKQINKKYLLYLIVSLIGLILMFISPGSLKRANIENIEFNNLSLIEKIISNIPNFIYYTFIINGYMIILMIISNYYLIKNTIKRKSLKIISYLYFLIPPLVITIFYLISNFINISIFSIFNQDNMVLTLYFISYIIFDIFLIYLSFHGERINIRLLFYFLGILSNCVMLLSPTWGYRTSFLTYLLLTVSFIMIIDYFYKDRKIVNRLLPLISICVFCFYIILYLNVHKAQLAREESIKLQQKNEIIEIEKFLYFVNCNINPDNSYHVEKFKEYYNIDKSKKIKLIDGNWKFKIFYKKS